MAILGIDEVGRGPWAGPLVIGAVILPDEKPEWINELNDSKKLTAKKRKKLSEIILDEAKATGLGWVMSDEIDEIGLSEALKLAARRAVSEVQKKHVPFTEIIIDGTQNFLVGTPLEKYVSVLPKADFLIKEVSAASIIAKVARDNYMIKLAEKYPEYGFEKHVGYGTAAHKKALDIYGPCREHRRSFKPIADLTGVDKMMERLQKRGKIDKDELVARLLTNVETGRKAEEKVANFLESRGHTIIERNAKTKMYEIDIISTDGTKIYFTEVKYRKNSNHGTPLQMISKEKLQQMTFAANAYLNSHRKYNNLSPVLAATAVEGQDYKILDWFSI